VGEPVVDEPVVDGPLVVCAPLGANNSFADVESPHAVETSPRTSPM
jgi:hypothetical protein